MYNVVVRTTSAMHILYLILFESSDCVFLILCMYIQSRRKRQELWLVTSIIYVSYDGSNEP